MPEIIAVSEDSSAYLQVDLGVDVLYDMYVRAKRKSEGMENVEHLLCKTMSMLPKIQFEGAFGFDFSKCCHQPSYDRRMLMFDLN